MNSTSTQGFDADMVSLMTQMPILKKSKYAFDEKQQSVSQQTRSILSWLWACFIFLLPSFVTAAVRQNEPGYHEKLRSTAYLDGIRGVAAWTVFNAHLSAVLSKGSGAGWGHDETHREFYKLPFFRLLYDGNFAVGIFFVVSGFALSISFIEATKKSPKDPGHAFQKLAGAIVRRPMRLFLPSFVSTLVAFVLVRLCFFTSLQSRQLEFDEYITGWPVLGDWPPRYPSFLVQLLDMIKVDADMLKILADSTDSSFKLPYNSVLWTIKLEFRSSLILFLTHAALYFIRRPLRIGLTVGLILLGLATSSYDPPHFWAGYLIAEFADFSGTDSSPTLTSLMHWLAIVAGLYLGSFASWQPERTPWCAWLLPLTPFGFSPADRFWAGLGAALTVFSFKGLPWLVRLFNSSLVQYFGKISFALYLVHFWMVQGVGTLVYYHIWSLTGRSSVLAETCGFFLGYAAVLGLTVWVADVFWRAVDIPLVSLASKWQKKMFEF